MAYDNTNRGALFQVEPENKKPNGPDWKGAVEIKNPNGGPNLEYWVSSWRCRSQKGRPYLSLSLTPKDNQKPAAPAAAKEEPSEKQIDDIPW